MYLGSTFTMWNLIIYYSFLIVCLHKSMSLKCDLFIYCVVYIIITLSELKEHNISMYYYYCYCYYFLFVVFIRKKKNYEEENCGH